MILLKIFAIIDVYLCGAWTDILFYRPLGPQALAHEKSIV